MIAEMSFRDTFPPESTARSVIECIPCPMTVRDGKTGIHTNSTSANSEISVSGVNARIWLEPLRPNRWAGVIPTVSSVTIIDPPANLIWHLEPTIRFDEIQDLYDLTLAPNAAVRISVVVTAGDQSMTIPLFFTEPTPLHE